MSIELAVLLGFVAHMVGDYVFQSDWMAAEKTRRWPPAISHGLVYAIPFLPILWLSAAPSYALVLAMATIAFTHIPIDHWRLARYVCWAKNQLAPARWRHRWDEHVSGTGYHVNVAADPYQLEPECYAQQKPPWMSVWLMIAADNTIHVTINTAALWWALSR